MINIERKRQRQHDNFLQLRLMLSTMLILDCVNVYLRLDLMDIMAEIRKTDSNDSHLYKHDIQPALSKQIFPANSKYTLWRLYCSVQSDKLTQQLVGCRYRDDSTLPAQTTDCTAESRCKETAANCRLQSG